MQKKMRKLSLGRETLRALTPRELASADGNGTTLGTSETSTPTLSCASCFAACSKFTAC